MLRGGGGCLQYRTKCCDDYSWPYCVLILYLSENMNFLNRQVRSSQPKWHIRLLRIIVILAQTVRLPLQVSMLTRQTRSSQQQSQELFVYDVPTGTMSICSFGDESIPAAPQQHLWDAEHPLLLACELATAGNAMRRTSTTAEGAGLEVATLFATPQGIVLQERQPIQDCQVLLPLCCKPELVGLQMLTIPYNPKFSTFISTLTKDLDLET